MRLSGCAGVWVAGLTARAAFSPAGSAAEQQRRLSCGKVCHKQLPLCPHACLATCHAGGCPQVEACGALENVRCPCKRRKEKWPCKQIQATLPSLTPAIEAKPPTQRPIA